MTGEDKGPLVTPAASRIEFSLRKAGSEKNNDFGICLEGRNRNWDLVLWRAEGSLECL